MESAKKELSLKEIQARILDVMKDIDRFCRKNNVPYTISSGTLLGAVRHGGFIPWDDDADMFMLREDFDRFIKIYRSDRYKLLFGAWGEDNSRRAAYIKIYDPETFGEEDGYGIFVDIFPLDRVPADKEDCKKYMHKVMRLHNRLYHRQRKDFVSVIKSYRHSLDWWWNKLDCTVHSDEFLDSPMVAHIVGTVGDRTIVNRDRFLSLTDTMFEGYPFLGFSDPHSYLSMVYGDDYMTPKQWSHNLKVYSDE